MGDVQAERARVILDASGIERAATRIAHEIVERDGDTRELVLVAILAGGRAFAELVRDQLRQLVGHEIPLGALDVTLYRDDVIGRGRRPVPNPTRMPVSVSGKRVVLIDEVVFTGRTVRAAMDAIIDFGRPKAIQVAALVDRGHREFPIKVDFVGKNIPTKHSDDVVLRRTSAGELEVVM